MLTRLEISGFKTFDDASLNVPPFLAIVGPNASGKSNLFDALQFLTRLTSSSLNVALTEARGELAELFRNRADGSMTDRIQFAVEVLLNPTVRDPWGTERQLTQTRIRYELELVRRTDGDGNVRLYVDREEAHPIRKSKDTWLQQFQQSSEFVAQFIKDGRRTSPFLETVDANGQKSFRTRQDGVQGRARPAEAAEATVLSSMTSAEFQHLYALREEILSWRFLQLDSVALRQPGEKYGDEQLQPSGANLARVLHRIQAETASPDEPAGVLSEISIDLASLIEGVRGVRVVENAQTRKWEIRLITSDHGEYSSAVASDGTLRILALLAALYDPRFTGMICLEEPENGVHPLRLRTLVQYMMELVADMRGVDDFSAGLTQLIVNSHSPVVLATVPDESAVVVDSAVIVEEVGGERVASRVSRIRTVSRGDNATLPLDELRHMASPTEIRRYEAAALLDGE